MDVNLLAQAIEDILEDKILSFELRKAGRKKFEDKFQIDYFKNNMLKAYDSLLT
jgi:glycosyltransferase involved in cell wall biosynthesis